jgi:AcrR family transcriptional regulator
MSEPTASPDPRLAARRRELVEAAYAVFADRGYRAAGVADIVKHAGVSHGTFYNYFDNKRHILDAVLDYSVEHLIEEVIGEDRPGAAETSAEFAAQFRAFLRRLFDVLEREPRLVEFVMLEAPAIDAELVTRLSGLFGTLSSLTNEYVHSGVERGYLRGDIDPQIASECLLALLFSVVVLAARGPVAAADRERHVNALTDFAVAGVLA